MKVILTKDLEHVGKAGTLVEVKTGFGRNYLLPNALAVLATAKNVRQLEHEKSGILARASKHKANMTAQANKLSSLKLSFQRKVGEEKKMFGSVTSKDIFEQLHAQGYEIDRKQIHLTEPIKEVGDHEVEVKLHPEVSAKIKVSVAAEA